jgi:hypothetical protein
MTCEQALDGGPPSREERNLNGVDWTTLGPSVIFFSVFAITA